MAVSLLQQLIDDGMEHNGFLKKALELAAEAQSALRMAVETVNARPDNDQVQIHHWIRQIADEKRIVIRRHMSLDDGADPTRWADLQDRINQFASEIDRIRKQATQRTKLLAKAQYHARVIGEGHGTVDDRRKVVEVVDALVSDGVPPSSTDLRDLLVPIIYDISDVDAPSTFQRVLGEVERHLVSDACRGMTLVVIGEEHSRAFDTLKSAFCLKEVVGVPVGADDFVEVIEQCVARPDVAAALLVICGDDDLFHEMEALCGQYGKKVFLSKDCTPHQVAHSIFQQWRENRRANVGAAHV
jgi:flagellar biosynthesis chaperone FliJ